MWRRPAPAALRQTGFSPASPTPGGSAGATRHCRHCPTPSRGLASTRRTPYLITSCGKSLMVGERWRPPRMRGRGDLLPIHRAKSPVLCAIGLSAQVDCSQCHPCARNHACASKHRMTAFSMRRSALLRLTPSSRRYPICRLSLRHSGLRLRNCAHSITTGPCASDSAIRFAGVLPDFSAANCHGKHLSNARRSGNGLNASAGPKLPMH
jgi:hypothetical protein